ncbi:MAG: hypothetical protein LBN27_04980 [Prevotellaceae bacterium]|jgi:hypothetical protein|nr:hypothetical protein [Prevotellaceae bacterium]
MKKNIFLLIISCLFVSCAKDEVMDRTIFIPDEGDSTLPAYTEWGYNSFGADYERSYFLVSNNIVPCKVLYKDGKLSFSLNGIYKERGYGYYANVPMMISVSFPMSNVAGYTDLVQLNDVKINLAVADCTVKILKNEVEIPIDDVLDGSVLYFKRAQLLNIDESPNRTILSGTFDLRFIRGGYPESISDGRFDVGINNDVFYAY